MGGGEGGMWGVVMVSGPTIKSLCSVRAFSLVRPMTAILRVWPSGSINHCSRSDWEGWTWGGVRVCWLWGWGRRGRRGEGRGREI